MQVFLLGVPDEEALGLLGCVLQFNGTEEWLHLGFNSLYLACLYALIISLWRITPAGLPKLLFAAFLVCSVWMETWHIVEHGVIISHVIANGGCPCPGIGDVALGVSDTLLHSPTTSSRTLASSWCSRTFCDAEATCFTSATEPAERPSHSERCSHSVAGRVGPPGGSPSTSGWLTAAALATCGTDFHAIWALPSQCPPTGHAAPFA